MDDFLSESCGCKLGPHHAACSSVVSKVAIVQTRNNCLQMTRVELDLVIMAQFNALRTQASDQPPSQHRQGGFRPHMKFFFHGMQILLQLLSCELVQSASLLLAVHADVKDTQRGHVQQSN